MFKSSQHGYTTALMKSLNQHELRLIIQAVNTRKLKKRALIKALVNHHPGKHCILEYNLKWYEFPSSTPWKEKWAYMRQLRNEIDDDIQLIKKLRIMIKEDIEYWENATLALPA